MTVLLFIIPNLGLKVNKKTRNFQKWEKTGSVGWLERTSHAKLKLFVYIGSMRVITPLFVLIGRFKIEIHILRTWFACSECQERAQFYRAVLYVMVFQRPGFLPQLANDNCGQIISVHSKG
jgi:hypothetical protein